MMLQMLYVLFILSHCLFPHSQHYSDPLYISFAAQQNIPNVVAKITSYLVHNYTNNLGYSVWADNRFPVDSPMCLWSNDGSAGWSRMNSLTSLVVRRCQPEPLFPAGGHFILHQDNLGSITIQSQASKHRIPSA